MGTLLPEAHSACSPRAHIVLEFLLLNYQSARPKDLPTKLLLTSTKPPHSNHHHQRNRSANPCIFKNRLLDQNNSPPKLHGRSVSCYVTKRKRTISLRYLNAQTLTHDGVVQSCAEGGAWQQAPQGVTVTSPVTLSGCWLRFWVSIQKQPRQEAQPRSYPKERYFQKQVPAFSSPPIPDALPSVFHQVTIHSKGSLILSLCWAVGSWGVSQEAPFESLKGPESSG